MQWLDEPLHALGVGAIGFAVLVLLLVVGAWLIGALDVTFDDGDW